MLSQLRNSVFVKILWGLMGLCLLNLSVDSDDLHPGHITEDLSINDQESVIELVVEQFLGYENAFAEYDDHDTEDHNKKSNLKIDLFVGLTVASNSTRFFFKSSKQKLSHPDAFLTSGFHQLVTPPPKV